MTGLVEWLLAEIAEDERIARGGRPWLVVDGQRIEDDLGHVFAYVSEPQVREHIARWDPARVLAECNTKRRIIERCQQVVNYNTSDDFGARHLAEEILSDLAQCFRGPSRIPGDVAGIAVLLPNPLS